MPIPDDAIIRINLAWCENIDEDKKIINDCKQDIYLDYPDGRSKPPVPKINLNSAIQLAKNDRVKYFAVSNCDIEKVIELKDSVDCIFVPKIETIEGVNDIPRMIEEGIEMIMLDKEDLYTDCKQDSKIYNQALFVARSYKNIIKILELQGVVFI